MKKDAKDAPLPLCDHCGKQPGVQLIGCSVVRRRLCNRCYNRKSVTMGVTIALTPFKSGMRKMASAKSRRGNMVVMCTTN